MLGAPTSPKIFAVANQKGGVGKTTTAINLGAAFAAVGKRVLLIDMDPQGNASVGIGAAPPSQRDSLYQCLIDGGDLQRCILPTTVQGLALIPATPDLSGMDIALADARNRAFRLRELLGVDNPSGGAAQAYDYVLIDCPPSLNLLTVNAMVAATGVLAPLQCEFFALEGLTQLLNTINHVKERLNPGLVVQGVVLTMFDGRNNLDRQVAEDVRGTLGRTVYKTVIPRNVRLSEAPSHGQPALLYDLACRGSQAYVALAGEVLRREDGRAAA